MSVCLISMLVISDEISMGRSFRDGLCENSHRIGLDRPALSAPHPLATFGWHAQRLPLSSLAGQAGRAGGGLSFHALTVQPSAAGRIPMRVDGRMYSIESRTC